MQKQQNPPVRTRPIPSELRDRLVELRDRLDTMIAAYDRGDDPSADEQLAVRCEFDALLADCVDAGVLA